MSFEERDNNEKESLEKALRVTPTYEALVGAWVEAHDDSPRLEAMANDWLLQLDKELAASTDETDREYVTEAIAAVHLWVSEFVENPSAPSIDFMKRACRKLYTDARAAAIEELKSLTEEDFTDAAEGIVENFPDAYDVQKPADVSWGDYLVNMANRDALVQVRTEKRRAALVPRARDTSPQHAEPPGAHPAGHIFTGGQLEQDGSISPDRLQKNDIVYVTLSVTETKNGPHLSARMGTDGDKKPLKFFSTVPFISFLQDAYFAQDKITVVAQVREMRDMGAGREVLVGPVDHFYRVGDVVEPVAYISDTGSGAEYVLPDGQCVPVTAFMQMGIHIKTGYALDGDGAQKRGRPKKQFPMFRLVDAGNGATPARFELVTKGELQDEDDLLATLYGYLGALNDSLPFKHVQENPFRVTVGPSVDSATRTMSRGDRAALRTALIEATKKKPLVVAIEARRDTIVKGVRALAERGDLHISPELQEKFATNIMDVTITDLDTVAEEISRLSEDVRQEFFPLDTDSELFVSLLRDVGLQVSVVPLTPSASIQNRLTDIARATRGRLMSGDLTHGSGTRFVPLSYMYKEKTKGGYKDQERTGMLLQIDEGFGARSAAEELFKLLQRLGFYEVTSRAAALTPLVMAVSDIDSFRGPAYDSYDARKKTYEHLTDNFYGNAAHLSEIGQMPAIIEFFRTEVLRMYHKKRLQSPRARISEIDAEILEDLQTLDVTKIFSVDDTYHARREKDKRISDEVIAVYEQKGFVMDTAYGKILIDPVGAIPLAQMAAFGHGYDGFVSYNPFSRLAIINIAGFVKDARGKQVLLPHNLLTDKTGAPLGAVVKEGRYWTMGSEQRVKQGGLAGGLADVLQALAGERDTSEITALKPFLDADHESAITPERCEAMKRALVGLGIRIQLDQSNSDFPPRIKRLISQFEQAKRQGDETLPRTDIRADRTRRALRAIEDTLTRLQQSPGYPSMGRDMRHSIAEYMTKIQNDFKSRADWPNGTYEQYEKLEAGVRDDVEAVMRDMSAYVRHPMRPGGPFRSAEIFQDAARSSRDSWARKKFILDVFSDSFDRCGVAAYFGASPKNPAIHVFQKNYFEELLEEFYANIYGNARP